MGKVTAVAYASRAVWAWVTAVASPVRDTHACTSGASPGHAAPACVALFLEHGTADNTTRAARRFIECRVLYDVDAIAQLYTALQHIVLVSQPFADLGDRWLSAARVLLDTFRYQLHDVLHLDFQTYWDYYQAMLEPSHSYQLGILGTARVLYTSATLCKSVRPWPRHGAM